MKSDFKKLKPVKKPILLIHLNKIFSFIGPPSFFQVDDKLMVYNKTKEQFRKICKQMCFLSIEDCKSMDFLELAKMDGEIIKRCIGCIHLCLCKTESPMKLNEEKEAILKSIEKRLAHLYEHNKNTISALTECKIRIV